MAYLDLNAEPPMVTIGRTLTPTIERRTLDRAEREAVMLARTDRRSSIRPVGTMRRLAQRLFGLRAPNPLADPRLEALRRFAVAVAHDTPASSDREAAQLVSHGFADAQIDRARSIAERFRPAERAQAGHLLILPMGIAAGTVLVDRTLGDAVISAIAVMTIALPVWAAMAPRRAHGG